MNILITGGNRGLGLELVLQAAGRGHHVYATVRDSQGAAQLMAALDSHSLARSYVSIHYADMRDEAAIAEVASNLQQAGVKLDSLINSAAILVAREATIESLNLADVEQSFDVNVYGPIRVAKHLISLLQDNGSLINISSEAGSFQNAYGGDYPYALTKAALNMFSLQLKKLLAKRGIQVWSIHPGWMRTDMGGSNAPLSAAESAAALIDIVEGKVDIDPKLCFIDYTGKAMPL